MISGTSNVRAPRRAPRQSVERRASQQLLEEMLDEDDGMSTGNEDANTNTNNAWNENDEDTLLGEQDICLNIKNCPTDREVGEATDEMYSKYSDE